VNLDCIVPSRAVAQRYWFHSLHAPKGSCTKPVNRLSVSPRGGDRSGEVDLKKLEALVRRWAWILIWIGAGLTQAADGDRIVKKVTFEPGRSGATLTGQIRGRTYVDYQLRAAAGQTMKAVFESPHGAAYFNLLPPGSPDAAMYVGQSGDNRFEGLLPADGNYTLRVYLMRSAARRDETADYTLNLAVTGKALKPLPGRVDARDPETGYHATTTVPCVPAYSEPRECEAGVIRYGHDGTATVEVNWETAGGPAMRRILFIKGEPKASDTFQPMTFTKNERGETEVVFGGEERFTVQEALVFGG
jgi:hypothetical protein